MSARDSHFESGVLQPLPLAEQKSFLQLTYPFSFDVPTTWAPTKEPFRRVVTTVESTTVGQTNLRGKVKSEMHGETCWIPYDGGNYEYLLPHIQEFLFSRASEDSSSGGHGSSSDYTVALELNNRVKQALLPQKPEATHFLFEKNGSHHDVSLRLSNVRLFLFRSQVGLLIFTLDLGSEVRTSETVPLKPVPSNDSLLWREHALQAHSSETDEPTGHSRSLTLDDLVALNYRISRVPRGEDTGPCLYRKKRVPRDHVFPSEDTAPNWTPEYFDVFRPLSLSRFARSLLDGPLGKRGEAYRDSDSESSATWSPFHENRFLTYVFGLIDDDDPDTSCSYEAVQHPLYYLRRSLDERYLPTPDQLRDTENPEVLRTYENIALGFSTEGGAVLAWPTPDNREFITQQLPSRIRRNYFFLHLLALHQRYACIYLARQIGNIDYREFRSSSRDTIKAARRLREQIHAFLVRSWFHDVSDRRTYTQVYHHWQRILDTRQHFEEVKSQVGELDDYLQRIRSDRESRFADLISWVIVPLILVINALSMNFVELQGLSITNPRVWGWTGGVTALYFLAVWAFRRVMR